MITTSASGYHVARGMGQGYRELSQTVLFYAVALFSNFCGAASALGAPAGQGILEDIQILADSQVPGIVLKLSEPVRLVQYAPASSGDRLEIRVRRLTPKGAEEESPYRRSLPPTPTAEVPLAEVGEEGGQSQDVSLFLRFQRPVTFRVLAGDDARSVTVMLVNTGAASVGPGGGASPAEPAAAGAMSKVPSPPGGAGNNPAPQAAEAAAKAESEFAAEPSAELWMERGRAAMLRDDYSDAIGYFTKVLKSPGHQFHQESLEMVGLARERNGQTARAKAEYEEYLRLYPQGEDAGRVQQRLAGLLTGPRPASDKLRTPGRSAENAEWEFFGSFSQYFRRDAFLTDMEGEKVFQSSLTSDLDFTGRYRDSRYDFRTQFDARYLYDLENDARSRMRVSYAYVDGSDRQTGLSARLGRQTRSSGGVLGRFDGGAVSYRFSPQWQITAVGGFPVQPFRSLGIATDRSFYGLSVDFGPFWEYWAGNAFVINQTADGITDRRAVGGELRYLHRKHPVFALLDYDIAYNVLNTAHVVANWNFDGGATAYAMAEYRKTPVLATSNALMGEQDANSVSDLLGRLTERDLRRLAQDRTGVSRAFTLGGNLPLDDHFQLNGDISLADYTGTKASGSVPASRGSGVEVSYSAQVVGSKLWSDRDVSLLGLRYTDRRDFDILSLSLDGRYPITPTLRLDPRLRVDYYTGLKGGDVTMMRPALRLNYQPMKNLNLEIEGGFEWSNKPLFQGEHDSKGYFIGLGYRLDF